MRARGACATDVAILVVAADDGVMPQTVEAINHAKEANVPIVVAINKMDRRERMNKIMAELAEHGLQPEEWGGQTIMVPISAKKREGIEQLLESVLLVSEVMELKANANRPAVATVVESHLDPNLGPLRLFLLTRNLSVETTLLWDKLLDVKTMRDHLGKSLKNLALPIPLKLRDCMIP